MLEKDRFHPKIQNFIYQKKKLLVLKVWEPLLYRISNWLRIFKKIHIITWHDECCQLIGRLSGQSMSETNRNSGSKHICPIKETNNSSSFCQTSEQLSGGGEDEAWTRPASVFLSGMKGISSTHASQPFIAAQTLITVWLSVSRWSDSFFFLLLSLISYLILHSPSPRRPPPSTPSHSAEWLWCVGG